MSSAFGHIQEFDSWYNSMQACFTCNSRSTTPNAKDRKSRLSLN